MNIWMKISDDKYELPVAVADTVTELAQICGITKETIIAQRSRQKRKGTSCRYLKIEVEDDEEQE